MLLALASASSAWVRTSSIRSRGNQSSRRFAEAGGAKMGPKGPPASSRSTNSTRTAAVNERSPSRFCRSSRRATNSGARRGAMCTKLGLVGILLADFTVAPELQSLERPARDALSNGDTGFKVRSFCAFAA